MKVAVQNGCAHVLGRQDVESILPVLPKRIDRTVTSITLYQGDGDGLFLSFHKKEKAVGLYCPIEAKLLSKREAIEFLVAGILCIDDRGDWPDRLPESRMAAYIEEARQLLDNR